MSKRITCWLTVMVFSTILVVSGCGTRDMGPKEKLGTAGGAILGGYIGSKFGGGDTGKLWTTGAGAVLGALIGSEIGRQLDEADRLRIARTTQASLEFTQTGETSTWYNPDTNNSGSVTPTRTFQRESGTYCREFRQTVRIGDKTEEAYGTACRQEDGTWKIQ